MLLPLQVDLVINNAVCKGGLGSVELNITGGLEPIEVNTFGLDISAIPPGDGYVIHVSDASGNNYSLVAQIITLRRHSASQSLKNNCN